MPDGEYEFTDYMDDDGVTDNPITLKCKITVVGDEITYDFTGTSPQVRGAMNNPYGSSKAMVITGLREMMNPDIPRNSGAWRPVTLIIPEGNFLKPSLPAAVASRGGTQARQSDVMLGAEAQIRPDKIPACTSNVDHLLNIGGRNKNGKPFILIEAIWGGWGGTSQHDGVDYNTPPWQNGSNQPCEVNEELEPIMYNQYGYLPDREGAGKYRGSVAIVREWKFTGDEAILQLRTDRQDYGTWGLYGGMGGASSESIINPDTENHHIGKATMRIKKGDVYRLITSGGGGWGDPLERDPKLVLKDVRDDKVSVKRARETYGVVIQEPDMEVDMAETLKLRETMRGIEGDGRLDSAKLDGPLKESLQ
jgi:N-methylhydantoinase B